MKAVKNMPSAMRFMGKKIQEQNPEFVIDIVLLDIVLEYLLEHHITYVDLFVLL